MIIDGKRALAHIQKVEWIRPIEGADNIELIGVLGWVCIAKKGEFKANDLCVYFEIDSKLPEEQWSEFLRSKDFKIKTLKLNKFKVISQGLALPLSAFSSTPDKSTKDAPEWVINAKINDDLTDILNVTYSIPEDNARKKAPVDKKRLMIQKHPYIFKQFWAKWLMKREWGRVLMFGFFGTKSEKNKNGFPTHLHYVHKSDEERVENIPFILNDKLPWIVTTKIDGTSCLYALERKRFGKREFYVCSRNVRQMTPSQDCYHKDNVYWEIENKYHIRDFLEAMLNQHPEWDYVALQGEGAGCSSSGAKIQGDPHGFNELRFFAYNFIDSVNGRWNSVKSAKLTAQYGIEWVPIVDTFYFLNQFKDMEEFKQSADGVCEAPGAKKGTLREGYVYRSLDGQRSFKNVSRKYLLKHSL